MTDSTRADSNRQEGKNSVRVVGITKEIPPNNFPKLFTPNIIWIVIPALKKDSFVEGNEGKDLFDTRFQMAMYRGFGK